LPLDTSSSVCFDTQFYFAIPNQADNAQVLRWILSSEQHGTTSHTVVVGVDCTCLSNACRILEEPSAVRTIRDIFFMACEQYSSWVRKVPHTYSRRLVHTLVVYNHQMVENILGFPDGPDSGDGRSMAEIGSFPFLQCREEGRLIRKNFIGLKVSPVGISEFIEGVMAQRKILEIQWAMNVGG
jgi:hypothetical protein